MGSARPKTYDDTMLERFLDGALGDVEARAVSEAVARDSELRSRLDEMQALRRVLHEHLEHVADEIDFSGLTERVLAQVEAEPRLSLTTRLGAWLGEVFSYRKLVWVPSMAVAAAAAVLLFLPRVIDQAPALTPEAVAANAGVEVRSLETGTELAMVYELPESKTTVIWIADHSDEAEGKMR